MDKKVMQAIDKLLAVHNEVSQFVLERDEALQVIMLAIVAKRNAFFLGKTGQAKSYAVNEFVKRITGATYYEVLMNKMMDKDEVFGRLDIPELVQGREKLTTLGKLPEAHFNFLDELFKSGEIMLNSLLKVLNFEEITLEGTRLKLQTIATFTASNEIPNFKREEDEILKPLWDRLHLKVITNYIQDRDNYKKAVSQKRARVNQALSSTISLDEIKLLNAETERVTFPNEIDDLMWEICCEIHHKLGHEVSDRKRIEYSVLLQANALLNKRDTVIPDDLKVLRWYLWDLPEEADAIKDIIYRFAENPLKDKVLTLKDMAREQIEQALKNADMNDLKNKNKVFVKAEKEMFQLHTAMVELNKEAKTRDDEVLIAEAFADFNSLYASLNKKFGYTEVSLEEMKARQGA